MSAIAVNSKENRVPTRDEFRQVGYTGYAAQFPLNVVQQQWLADFNGVSAEQMPDAWRYAPNEHVLASYEKRLSNTGESNPVAKMLTCGVCRGSGGRKYPPYSDGCDFCGGSGKRRKCMRRDCQEFGCSGYGDCYVSKATNREEQSDGN